MHPLRVLAFVHEINGCTMWRTMWPFHACQRHRYPAYWEWSERVATAPLTPMFDAYVLARSGWLNPRDGVQLRKRVHRAGKLLLAETDDDVWLSRHEQKSAAELHGEESPRALKENTPAGTLGSTKVFDGMTVTTERLRTVLRTVAPELPVEVVPNAIDLEWWAASLEGWRRELPQLTIGWAGGDRYDRDVEVLAEAWRRVAAAEPEVHFVIQGHQAPPLVAAVPPERFHAIGWLPCRADIPELPPYSVGLLNIDIGCASVAPTMFNAAKTPIKLWEYTASGAAVVGCSWLYGPFIENGVDGYIADTADEWEAALLSFVRDAQLRQRFQARMLTRVVERHSMQANWWRWPDAWAKLAEAAGERTKRRHVLVAGRDD